MELKEEGERPPRLCTSAAKQCPRAGQTGCAPAGPSTGFPSAASSEPPSTHCHHDSGRQQLVTWRCEEGVQADTLMSFLRDSKEHDVRGSHIILCLTAKKSTC